MLSASFGIFLLVVPAIIFITIVAFLIYRAVYDKHTNKVLESGETKKRKWIAPWAFTLIVFGALLILVAGIIFPLSMFMIDPATRAYEACPVSVDVSDSVKFVVDDADYATEVVLDSGDVYVESYVRQNKDGSTNYIYIGKITGVETGPVTVDAELSEGSGGMNGMSSSSLVQLEPGTTEVNFKCEVLIDADSKTHLDVGIKYGVYAYSENYVQQFSADLG